MAGFKGVVLAFTQLGETADALVLTQGVEAVPPAGYQFVGIALVPDVPDQLVGGRIEHIMQGQSQFNDPEARAEMTAGDGHGIDQKDPDLFGQSGQLAVREVPYVCGAFYPVEQVFEA